MMPVRDVYTPVLKFRMNTTDVDLLFAPLDLEKLPDPLAIMDDSLMNGLDDVSVRSLNGARVAEYLLDLVPDQSVFRVALRAIKKWARCKGLYSNVLGLLGGINCAILVAFVCQKYPLKDPAVVLEKFFRIMEVWEWPNPIMLRQPSADDARAWNPRYCAVSLNSRESHVEARAAMASRLAIVLLKRRVDGVRAHAHATHGAFDAARRRGDGGGGEHAATTASSESHDTRYAGSTPATAPTSRPSSRRRTRP